MKLEFGSIEEVKEFVTQLKGMRGKKGDGDGEANPGPQAPAPVMPPTGAPAFQGAGATQGFTPPAASPFPAATGGDPHITTLPHITALVQRISVGIDTQLARGSDPNSALTWFRQQCGPEAAAATMDQIKAVFLPRLPMAALENIAKLTGA
jgi:hypothetical protein